MNYLRLSLIGLLVLSVAPFASARSLDIWIGTATPPGGPSEGIYHLLLDDETGKLAESRLVAEVDGPGFLSLHPNGKVLYSTGTVEGEPSVLAFDIVRTEEGVTLRDKNSQPTGDSGSAHVSVDQTGRVLFSAQYGGGSIASFPLTEDGTIGPRASLIEHSELGKDFFDGKGSGVDPRRQKAPHPHWTGVTPDNQYVLTPDLGSDRIAINRFDPATAQLTPHGSAATPPGGGPRHFAFHPNGRWGYVVNEMALTLSAFAYDAEQGKLTLLQTIRTLSESQKAGERHNSGSEVRVHPSGDFVYSANRGHDSITAFRIDPTTGQLAFIETEPIRGSWPRNFNLTPSGRWLLAAGRDSHTLSVFAIDSQTGELQYTLETASVPLPICVTVGE